MLPNMDPVQVGAVAGGGQAAVLRLETDFYVKKASEAYRGATREAESAEKGGKAARAELAAAVENKQVPPNVYAPRDEAQFGFRATPEERDALVAAFSGGGDAKSLTKEEKDKLKSASGRITRLIEEAVAKSADSRERTEKALSEWYSRLSQGETPRADLLKLLRQAAMGEFDEIMPG